MSVARSSPDGRYVASCGDADHRLVIYAVDAPALALHEVSAPSQGRLHARAINDIAWSLCSRHIATAGEDGVVVVWKVHENLGGAGRVLLEPRRVLRGHDAPVTCLAFNAGGSLVVSGGMDARVIVWSLKAGVLLKVFNAHTQPISAVGFSFDSELVLSASYDGLVRLWSTAEGFALRTLNVSGWVLPVLAARFSPNSEYVFVRYTDGQTRMIDIVGSEVARAYGPKLPAKVAEKTSMLPGEFAFARPDYLLVTTDHGVDVYNVQTQEKVSHLVDNVPVVCLDVNEALNVALCAGPQGVKLVRLDLPSVPGK